MVAIRISMIRPPGRAGAKLGPAALPVPVQDARAYQARGRIAGSPGTFPVPARSPVPLTGAAGLESARGRAGLGRVAQASQGPASGGMYLDDTLTPYWFPSIYYTTVDGNLLPPVSVYSDNQMPVPAIDPRGLPVRPAMAGFASRGQVQVANPRAAPWYPTTRPGS
jgi:hypothetical protein